MHAPCLTTFRQLPKILNSAYIVKALGEACIKGKSYHVTLVPCACYLSLEIDAYHGMHSILHGRLSLRISRTTGNTVLRSALGDMLLGRGRLR